MRRLIAIILLTLVLIVGGGLVFLMTWDIPAPSHTVEKTLMIRASRASAFALFGVFSLLGWLSLRRRHHYDLPSRRTLPPTMRKHQKHHDWAATPNAKDLTPTCDGTDRSTLRHHCGFIFAQRRPS